MRPVGRPTPKLQVTVTINGIPTEATVDGRLLLADFLRDQLDLTGTHLGCEHGVCGACTVLVDGDPVRSCIMLAAQVDGMEVLTVEGISDDAGLNRLQEAFKSRHGLQCGFCTPGFLMTLSGVEPSDYPDEESIRELLSGNICRCTGYVGIVEAVKEAWGII
ncbi:MAG: (2Fe-2S)-binding protein [bacterium]|nr:(2Fe-2S)-binding protein [bacterium]MDE0289615.1 (2Fe-2S)-binding protein [bacterium]MDE0440435.1 (2Fe-2S)-binding protein [bacterium]